MRADGRGVRQITRGRFDFRPAWSPDGRWIAYQSGKDRRRVVRGRDAHWSPDGWAVVFTPPDGGVATVPAAGGGSRFLSRGFQAEWSPDGKLIVYTRMGATPSQDTIWIMSRIGGNPHRILLGAQTPSWRP